MAFPQVVDADTKNGVQTSNSNSWTLTYPTNLASGDLILAFVATDGASISATWPAGWQLVNGSSGANSLCYAKKLSDGTESGNFTLSLSASEQGAWRIFRITGWHGTLGTIFYDNLTEAGDVIQAGATGASQNPNPPALNPINWDIEDTLWIAAAGVDTSRTFSGYPANYTNTAADVSGGSTGASLGTCRRENAAASEDPGTFTISTSDDWVAVVVAIRPAATGGHPMTADSGAFSIAAPVAATLRVGMPVSSGSFLATGTAATLQRGKPLAAASGAFGITGTDATLRVGLAAASGSFGITGTDATFKLGLPAASGSFAITGTEATLTKAGTQTFPFILGQNLGSQYNAYPGYVGFAFHTGSVPPIVTHLGRWKVSGNSLNHTVYLMRWSGSFWLDEGRSVVLNLSGGNPGEYLYGALGTPYQLLANTDYAIISSETNGGDYWLLDCPITSQTEGVAMSLLGSVSSGSLNSFTPAGDQPNTYGPVNMKTEKPTSMIASAGAFAIAGTAATLYRGSPFVLSHTLGTVRQLNEFTDWQIAFKFRTGDFPPTVSQLGRWKLTGNSQVHPLYLVKEAVPGTWVSVATVSVDLSGPEAVGTFVWGTLSSPVTLLANTNYAVSSLEYYSVEGEDSFYGYDEERMPDSTQDSWTEGLATPWGAMEFSPDFSNATTFNNPPYTYGPLNFRASPARRQVIAWAGAFAIAGTDATLTKQGAKILAAESGSFAVTGTDATPKMGYKVPASAGAFEATGTDATPKAARKFLGESGSFVATGTIATPRIGLPGLAGAFAITGTAAGVKLGHKVPAESGSFVATGTDAGLLKGGARSVVAESGAFSITGTSVPLRYGRLPFPAAAGAFTATGTVAGLAYGHKFPAATTDFAITGTEATLRVGHKVPASAGSFVATGTATPLRAIRKFVADSGAFAVTGTDVGLIYSGGQRVLFAGAGSFAVTGTDPILRAVRKLGAGAGAFEATGTSAATAYGHKVTAAAGAFGWTGTEATLIHAMARQLPASSGDFTITGSEATLAYRRRFTVEAGSWTMTGTAAGVQYGHVVGAESGSFTATGTDAGLAMGHRVLAAPGAFDWTGTAAGLVRQYHGVFVLSADTAAFVTTGSSVFLRYPRKFTAEAGSFGITGTVAGPRVGRAVVAAPGSFAATGTAAGLRALRRAVASPGGYAISGEAARLARLYTLAGAGGSFSSTGSAVGLRRLARVLGISGGFLWTGTAAELIPSMMRRQLTTYTTWLTREIEKPVSLTRSVEFRVGVTTDDEFSSRMD